MSFPTNIEVKPRRGRPASPVCKRGHAGERYANGTCRECQRTAPTHNKGETSKECKRSYYANNPKQILLNRARGRAREGGYACTITIADIVVPEFCPLLGVRLERALGNRGAQPNSPSLDKIKPELGYVPGNVWVISHRANSLKGNATLSELQMLVKNLEKAVHVYPWERS